jgi:acyl-CoA ligase (AMP-forming) (exosortase A-associated)
MHNILEMVEAAASRAPHAEALVVDRTRLTYRTLVELSRGFGEQLRALGTSCGNRIVIFLDKRVETVVSMLGAAAAGCVFVPVNPLLKAHQVLHVLRDCAAQCLVTSPVRAQLLGAEALASVPHLILVDAPACIPSLPSLPSGAITCHRWSGGGSPDHVPGDGSTGLTPGLPACIDTDLAAILYTSGSTGLPKGVMLSHRNLLEGAWSVSRYLHHAASDRILAALPLSFDAGLSQLTSAWATGATAILLNYLMPQDVITACERECITGMTGVPPLWMQLARATWPEAARRHLRYFANTGGRLPLPVLQTLRTHFPQAKPYLMYGLTEAFRSTYLDPAEVDRHPDSIGKAVPNARILVVREDGSSCGPDEVGELVHVGACVTLGYWNDAAHNALRYRPSPEVKPGGSPRDMAVWSGDLVRRDPDGYLYFVARNDAQIKSSGYRISPEEIEEVVHASGLVTEAVAVGVPDARLGESIVLLVAAVSPASFDPDALLGWCRQRLPPYMIPYRVIVRKALPLNPNGKFDRTALGAELGATPGSREAGFRESLP